MKHCTAWMIVVAWTVCTHADEPNSPHGLITLVGGDTASGHLVASSDENSLAWRNMQFDRPFQFGLSYIDRIEFQSSHVDQTDPDALVPVPGDVVVEIVGGDRLIGDVIAKDDQTLTVRTNGNDEVILRRATIRRLVQRDDGKAMTFVGPGELKDWTTIRGTWTSQSGRLSSNGRAAAIVGDVHLPPIGRIELELSWQTDPHFIVAIGVDPANAEESARKAFRIERWRDEIVAVWESEVAAELVSLVKVEPGRGRLRLTIEMDQKQRRAEIFSDAGQSLGVLQLALGQSSMNSGLLIDTARGIVQLDRLQVSRGIAVPAADFVPNKDLEKPTIAPENESTSRVRVMLNDGSQWTGSFISATPQELRLIPELTGKTIAFSMENVRVLDVIDDTTPSESAPKLLYPYFESGPTHLRCRLIPSPTDNKVSPWSLEVIGGSSAGLLPIASGRIVMRKPPPPAPLNEDAVGPARPRGMVRMFPIFLDQKMMEERMREQMVLDQEKQMAIPFDPTITLRTGETVSAQIVRLTEQDIELKAATFSVQRIPSDQVRSVQLAKGQPLSIEAIQRERLLTVPRMRKKNPPTHLLIATNGDVMRCRLTSIDERQVVVQSRLETITVDRSLVAQIVWLHPPDQSNELAIETDENRTVNLHAMLTNGSQIRIKPTGMTSFYLVGQHRFLGDTQIALDEIRELWFGDEMEALQLVSPEQSWQLKDARELELADENGERDPGTGSELIGAPAPHFKLTLLDGTDFDLSRQTGKVVVLDFWASWCGPCLQAMPMIDATVAQFDEADVQLVTVNLQETAKPIREALDRLKIDPVVAMDIDGVAAGRYQANAIPQTVVIDRAGNVARVFVGGGAKLAQQLHQAITETLQK